jgi:hypothetical protein
VSYLNDNEKKQIAPDSTQHIKQVWYKKRKAVLKKVVDDPAKMSKVDNILKEILIVLLKIYFELKKPK